MWEELNKNWILDDIIELIIDFIGYSNGIIVKKLPFLKNAYWSI